MVRQLLLSCVLLGSLGIVDAAAHHTVAGRVHPVVTKVTLPDGVMAGGKPLPAGTYELVVTEERPTVAPGGAASEAQRTVEFIQNGTVVAAEIAEVFPFSERPVGTSGGQSPRAVVQRLKSGDFLRIAVNGPDARYLIHLPTGPAPVQP